MHRLLFSKKVFMPILLLLLTLPLYAADVDHYSKRYSSITDSLDLLNEMTNSHLRRSLQTIQRGCKENILYKKLRLYFNDTGGRLTRKIISSNDLDKISVHIKESIYKNFSFRDAFMMKLAGNLVMADIMRVNDIYLGTDKLDHLWSSGYRYFEAYYLEQKKLSRALRIGWDEEHGLYGAATTGIISYGDLAANFNGMRFWNHILQKYEDVLGQNLGPYISCERDRWVQVKQISLEDYLDHSFDESINCSLFKNKKLLQKVQDMIKLRSEEQGVELTCPMNKEVIPALEEKYGKLAPYLLNFHGYDSKDNPKWKKIYPKPGD